MRYFALITLCSAFWSCGSLESPPETVGQEANHEIQISSTLEKMVDSLRPKVKELRVFAEQTKGRTIEENLVLVEDSLWQGSVVFESTFPPFDLEMYAIDSNENVIASFKKRFSVENTPQSIEGIFWKSADSKTVLRAVDQNLEDAKILFEISESYKNVRIELFLNEKWEGVESEIWLESGAVNEGRNYKGRVLHREGYLEFFEIEAITLGKINSYTFKNEIGVDYGDSLRVELEIEGGASLLYEVNWWLASNFASGRSEDTVLFIPSFKMGKETVYFEIRGHSGEFFKDSLVFVVENPRGSVELILPDTIAVNQTIQIQYKIADPQGLNYAVFQFSENLKDTIHVTAGEGEVSHQYSSLGLKALTVIVWDVEGGKSTFIYFVNIQPGNFQFNEKQIFSYRHPCKRVETGWPMPEVNPIAEVKELFYQKNEGIFRPLNKGDSLFTQAEAWEHKDSIRFTAVNLSGDTLRRKLYYDQFENRLVDTLPNVEMLTLVLTGSFSLIQPGSYFLDFSQVDFSGIVNNYPLQVLSTEPNKIWGSLRTDQMCAENQVLNSDFTGNEYPGVGVAEFLVPVYLTMFE